MARSLSDTVRLPKLSRPKMKQVKKPRAKKAAVTGWRTLACTEGFSVSGGFLKKPQFLNVSRVLGHPFAKVDKREGWLCMAASGKGCGVQPLSRTTLIEKLLEMFQAAEEEKLSPRSRDSMAGLVRDGDNGCVTPPKGATRRRSRAKPPGIVEVPVPACASCLAGLDGPPEGKVRLARVPACHAKNVVHVHLDDLPWVINTLRWQVLNGGVDYIPEANPMTKPWWSQRDHCWTCRAYPPNGEVMKKSITVSRRVEHENAAGNGRLLTPQELQVEKSRVYEQLNRWREDVEAGLIDQ